MNMPPACVYSTGDGNGKNGRQAAYLPDHCLRDGVGGRNGNSRLLAAAAAIRKSFGAKYFFDPDKFRPRDYGRRYSGDCKSFLALLGNYSHALAIALWCAGRTGRSPSSRTQAVLGTKAKPLAAYRRRLCCRFMLGWMIAPANCKDCDCAQRLVRCQKATAVEPHPTILA